MIIRIEPSDNEPGYMYDIYKNDSTYEDNHSEDGGLCTGSIDDAVEMAMEQAKGCAIEWEKEENDKALNSIAKKLASKVPDMWGEEPMDGDQTEDLSKLFLKELNKLMGNN